MKPVALTALALAALSWLACSDPVGGPAGDGDEPGRTSADSSDPGPDASSQEARAAAAVSFVDRAAETGLDFQHFNGATGNFYMAEVTGAGVGLLDFDLDGDLDVYFPQGNVPAPGKTVADAFQPLRHDQPWDRLYRNELIPSGNLTFTDVTEASGLRADGYGMGVAVGDVDGDGFPDLYLTNLEANQLWRNRGDGTFEDITARAGVGEDRWSVPALFFDYDDDGALDLFVGNYIAADLVRPKLCRGITGAQDYCGPSAYPPLPDRLWRNRGDGTFEDVTWAAGLRSGFGPALGAVTSDFNGDGVLDLYVANDQANNQLWIRESDLFKDQALFAGSAVNSQGRAEASMGVDVADFDGDGDDDLFMTHLIGETNTLYVNEGSGTFIDRSVQSGLASPSRLFTAFGTVWLDADGDGYLDLFVANGAVKALEQLLIERDPFPYHHPNQLFLNQGGERFEEVSELAGEVFALSEVSRGAAKGDLDNDGDQDLVVSNNGGPARLMINRGADGGPWIGFDLRHRPGGAPSLGARVALELDDGTVMWRRARRDGSFAGSNDPRVLFGLRGRGKPVAARIVWPGRREAETAVSRELGPESLQLGTYHEIARVP